MKMKIKPAHIAAAAYGVLSAAAFIFPEMAFAAELKDSMLKIHEQAQSTTDVLSAGSYIFGVGTGIKAALLFRDHNENPASTKLSKPLTYALVTGMLMGLPSFLTTGADSTGLTQKNSLSGGVLGGKLS